MPYLNLGYPAIKVFLCIQCSTTKDCEIHRPRGFNKSVLYYQNTGNDLFFTKTQNTRQEITMLTTLSQYYFVPDIQHKQKPLLVNSRLEMTSVPIAKMQQNLEVLQSTQSLFFERIWHTCTYIPHGESNKIIMAHLATVQNTSKLLWKGKLDCRKRN